MTSEAEYCANVRQAWLLVRHYLIDVKAEPLTPSPHALLGAVTLHSASAVWFRAYYKTLAKGHCYTMGIYRTYANEAALIGLAYLGGLRDGNFLC